MVRPIFPKVLFFGMVICDTCPDGFRKEVVMKAYAILAVIAVVAVLFGAVELSSFIEHSFGSLLEVFP